jgi:hypothetical protein
MKVVPLRLQLGDDLRGALEAWVSQHSEHAGYGSVLGLWAERW